METSSDYYSLLGVQSGASDDAIKRAYRLLAHRYHPDRNPGNAAASEKFKLLHDAYAVLSDAEKRAAYDAVRKPAPAPADHPDKVNGQVGVGVSENGRANGLQAGADSKSQHGEIKPRCPSCSVLGAEHLALRRGGAAAARGKQFIAAPFNVIFCDSCGHIYGVTPQSG